MIAQKSHNYDLLSRYYEMIFFLFKNYDIAFFLYVTDGRPYISEAYPIITGVNVSTILGIVVGVLILIILSGTGFFLFLKHKYKFIGKQGGVKRQTVSSYNTFMSKDFKHFFLFVTQS